MSAAASEAGKGSLESLEPEIESQTDQHETHLEYDPSSKLPVLVALVWVCALAGLVVYAVSWYLPDLAKWGKP